MSVQEELLNATNKLSLEDFSKERLCEIVTLVIDGLLADDYQEGVEYLQNWVDMSDEELEFFGAKGGDIDEI